MWKKLIFKFGIIFCIIFSLLLVVRQIDAKGLNGDQIHYLIMSQSIVEDTDLDLKNNYSNKTYNSFYNDSVNPHIPTRQFNLDSPTMYSLHNPGLPILISILWPFLGYKSGILVMVFFSTSLLLLTYIWSFNLTKDKLYSIISVSILALSTAFLSLNGYIFPNLILANLLIGAMIYLFKEDKKNLDYVVLGSILAVAPWVHVKALLAFGTIGIIALISTIKKSRKLLDLKVVYLCLFPTILLSIFVYTLWKWYGVILPSQTFAGDIIFAISPLKSFMASMFDSTKGILILNPVFALIICGLPIWYIKNRHQLAIIFLVIIPSLILQFSFLDWWGGWSPSNRYIMEYIPLLVPAITFAIMQVKNIIFRTSIVIFLIIQSIFAIISVFFTKEWFVPGDKNPVIEYTNQFLNIDLFTILPIFTGDLKLVDGKLSFIVCIIVIGLLFAIGVYTAKGLNTQKNP